MLGILSESFPEKAKMSAASTHVAISMGYWLVDRRTGSGRWCNARIDLVDELCYTKNG